MHGLGELETTVMDVLWRVANPCSVREVLTEINHSRTLAYTTVMTVLDNLHRKGWVQRERSGRAYLYRPVEAREEAAARALRDVLASTGDPDGVLLHFARSASDHESTILRRALGERKSR
ncbi:MAG: BlaI/MecI/CopY family transcriptional regulator [Actinomycetota bacterium]|nr:BlaI/MecI/CopY family transcriptional regulator [Actinomycetota bacterium]